MGLGGRKVKQRIGNDPRNLTWADDAAKFGQTYLQKLGWDPSKGLGASGEGRTSHIKVAQRLNLLGIGAGNASGDSTIAWKQNREYEMLLKRLNEGAEKEEAGEDSEDAKKETGSTEKEGKTEERERKRKKGDSADVEVDGDDSNERKKRKKEKKKKRDKRETKKKEVEEMGQEGEEKSERSSSKTETTVEATSPPPIIQAPTPRPMAHRARFLRSKQLASRSSTAVAEILGIPSTSASNSNSPAPSSAYASLNATPFPPTSESPTPGTTPSTSTPAPETNQDLRTSSTNVKDYFKEKLAARALALARDKSNDRNGSPSSSSPAPSKSASSPSSTAVPAVADPKSESWPSKDFDPEAPRAGLGSKAILNFSAPADVGDRGDVGDEPRRGLGNGVKFGNLMGGFQSSTRSLIPASGSDETRNGVGEVSSKVVNPSAPKATGTSGYQSSEGDVDERAQKKVKKEKRKGKKRKDAGEADVSSEAPKLADRPATSVIDQTRSSDKRKGGDLEKAEKKDKEKKKKRKEMKEERAKRQVDNAESS